VPIDLIGGTSIGSVIGALPAQEIGWRRALEICRRGFARIFDPMLPFVSLLVGRRIGRQLEEAFGTVAFEDLPIPYFCIATDLTTAIQTAHLRGSLFTAVRSSISLPGILPPVIVDGRMLVDGGLPNNLLVDVMGRLSDGGPIVAIDVSPEQDLRAAVACRRRSPDGGSCGSACSRGPAGPTSRRCCTSSRAARWWRASPATAIAVWPTPRACI
jgi:predicted acylesterase/phospholipase RssA